MPVLATCVLSRSGALFDSGDDQPLRAEPLSIEQLRGHAKALAARYAGDGATLLSNV
jgi:hypothetical protein